MYALIVDSSHKLRINQSRFHIHQLNFSFSQPNQPALQTKTQVNKTKAVSYHSTNLQLNLQSYLRERSINLRSWKPSHAYCEAGFRKIGRASWWNFSKQVTVTKSGFQTSSLLYTSWIMWPQHICQYCLASVIMNTPRQGLDLIAMLQKKQKTVK